MTFLAALLIDGALAGAVYALIALSFVVVYRASGMINFAVGECVMLGARLVGFGVHGLGLGLGGGLAVGGAGMVAVMVAFNEVVLRRLAGRPVVALVMITIGLATLIHGGVALLFGDVPASIVGALPDPVSLAGVPIAAEKMAAAAVAVLCVVTLSWGLRRSRMGVALRAIADDQQSAMAVGIDLHRYFGITWALVGVLESLAAGYLDPLVGGGFSTIASYLVLLAVLLVRPSGLFGRSEIRRV